MPSKWASRIEQISQVSAADFGCFMRVAHHKAPDYGIYGLLELLANFWQNGFLMTSPLEGESENCLVFIGDLNGGASCAILHRVAVLRACLKVVGSPKT
jgi:hypothetical protein